MSRGNGFFSNLKKSTRITLVSCGCFIALTAVILTFFVMFPITPSEKLISSFGRESIYKQDPQGTSPVTSVTTTMTNDILVSKATRTTTVTKFKRTEFTISITSGSGFFKGQKIPSGNFTGDYSYTPTTTTSVISGYTGSGMGTGTGTGTGTGAGTGTGTGTGTETPAPVEGGAGAGTETPAPVEGGAGAGTGTETPAPVEGGAGAGTGAETPAPVEGGGGAAAAPAE
ncbi:MAG: hypothetical protein IJJ81_05130 [Ruminococcus sp.]|nr:hypothetical protein [Ruminococcus sp.]